jgi:hypothetical protein
MNAAIRFAMIAGAGMLAATVAATDASAQDLSGRYRCVTLCEGGLQGQPAFVTQNGSQLNLLNEAGEPSRAWIDWPGHIWADRWQEGALYTNDGMAIHFDRGTIWERDLGEPPPPPPPAVIVVPGKHRPVKEKRVEAPAAPPPASVHSAAVSVRPAPAPVSSAFDGDWSVLISTQAGPCDRSYRYGVRIANGDVYYDGGGPVDVQGHVFSNGIVRVSVDGMGQHADGQGRLARGLGNGTWQGGGSLGSCAGVWQAERRG